ncbi:unnamed protein product [Diabrotica balteata]|uniref:Major facilitator superfamily (MFS) profile domain-containing protein n=1 Tax=Diabrotica balteata TaxID=107213 RepID=A0A9N9SQ28_DIABA|nr:unnamed protein product [Diabrotica balteata]
MNVLALFLVATLKHFLFQDYGGTLKWTSKEQSYILASFYWAYIISQIVGGLATQKLGTKRVFGYAQLATALCSICIPWASETHYGLVIGLRFIQGFASGLTWPAMYALVGHWIPVPERSRFMSSFQGLVQYNYTVMILENFKIQISYYSCRTRIQFDSSNPTHM